MFLGGGAGEGGFEEAIVSAFVGGSVCHRIFYVTL